MQLFSRFYVIIDQNKTDYCCMKGEKMSVWRVLLCLLFPPLAVLDKGCGSIIIVSVLTLVGWVPGVIGALVINSR